MHERDVFPRTEISWIDLKLLEGQAGLAELNRHIMEVYSKPLQVYFLGSTFRRLGEPGDIVSGFFADRLPRPDFLPEWRRSGKRLRHWLINGFKFYCFEVCDEVARRAHERELPEDLPADAADGALQMEVDRAFRNELLRRALDLARQVCLDKRLVLHWEVFVKHSIERLQYPSFCQELGLSPNRAAKMNEIVEDKVRDAIREILERDGVQREHIDEEIRNLLEIEG